MTMNAKKSFTTSPLTRRRFLELSAASAALALSPALWPRPSWSAEGNILKVRDYSDFKSLDPSYFLAVPEENINAVIYNKLISFKPGRKWEWELEAAKSIRQVDPTHIAFELKEGIVHSGGFGEMTAEDVKYSFERVADPDKKSPNIDDWGPLDKVEVTGKYSGTIVFKSPFQPVWWTTLPYTTGNIISMKATEKAGGQFSTEPPSFSGPYMLKEWKPSQRTVLARNPVWKGPKPDFDEIHIFPIDDEKTAEIAYESGDIDFTRVSITSLEKYQSSPPPNTDVIKSPSLYWLWLGLNQDNDKLKDIRVRKAVQLAVDVSTVVDGAYFGLAEPSTGNIPPGLLGHRKKSLLPLKGDINTAKALLAEAGYPNGIDLTLDILNKSTYNTIAQVIQANLAQAGIRVQINIHESGSFWVLGSEKDSDRWKDLQLLLNRFSSVPDPSYYTRWHLQNQVGIWNWERFRSDEYDALDQKALGEIDQEKRAAMYIRMQDIMEESGCFRFITNEVAPVVCRKTVIPGLRPDGTPLLRKFKKA
jgi:peptide/nickel transport system substrate-binding protein